MSIRSNIARFTGRTSQKLLRILKQGGGSLPGQIAQALDPNVLKEMANNYDTIIITGTNGKTLTTALTSNIMRQKYRHVLTNPTGSNMIQGIVSAFLQAEMPPKGERGVAVLEVDEASLIHVTKHIQPKIICVTNIFRDQIDRYGEIYATYQKILDGAAQSPNAIMLANGDSPIFYSKKTPNPQKFYGFDHVEDQEQIAPANTDGILCPHCHNILHYKMLTYANLGKYYCSHCDFKRPDLDYRVTKVNKLTMQSADFEIDGQTFNIPVAGLYNVYNALSAYSIASLLDINPQQIQAGFQASQKVFGRQEIIQLGNKEVMINLSKNPVGFNQIVDILALESEPFTLVSILNDRDADGTDVSWIWDAEYERLAKMPVEKVLVSGTRRQELKLRLEVADFNQAITTVVEDLDDLIIAIESSPTTKVYILATYTAVLDLRQELAKRGLVKERLV